MKEIKAALNLLYFVCDFQVLANMRAVGLSRLCLWDYAYIKIKIMIRILVACLLGNTCGGL